MQAPPSLSSMNIFEKENFMLHHISFSRILSNMFLSLQAKFLVGYQSILLLFFYNGREIDSNTFELCLYNLKYEKSVEDEFLFAIDDYAEHNSMDQA